MNYYRYAYTRMNEVRSLKFKLQKMFRVLSDRDFYRLQELCSEIEKILEMYGVGGRRYGSD